MMGETHNNHTLTTSQPTAAARFVPHPIVNTVFADSYLFKQMYTRCAEVVDRVYQCGELKDFSPSCHQSRAQFGACFLQTACGAEFSHFEQCVEHTAQQGVSEADELKKLCRQQLSSLRRCRRTVDTEIRAVTQKLKSEYDVLRNSD
eukprot:gnl/Spiro4/23549_TR11636_c0_g1_i1.p1 gnl/Spiro4/23549_TR11636_c0_g1~~gnl/Spiro4/23549_TR11636_c0_g1_i1.p1  ORF type:complete len:147 (+),score=33.82 gnl/Spiro4/23549_TR11636_c0_g1_i1:105-545(+)